MPDGISARRRVLVKHGFEEDAWRFSESERGVDVIVPLARHLESPAHAVRVSPKDDVRKLTGRLQGVRLIELVLPRMSEGRPYTQARLLRSELDYRGRLRVSGEVRRDLLFFLFRVGVDEAILKDPDEEAQAHQALTSFSVLYQGASDVDLPLWKRERR